MGKIIDYDKRRTKRLAYLLPVAFLVLIIILMTIEHTQIVDKFFSVGYQGPLRILPEITIIDDKSIEAEIFSEERHDMVAREIELVSDDERDVEEDDPELSTAPEKEVEEVFDDVTGRDFLRTYPSHTAVPFREDYVILNMVKPAYPEDALALRKEGYVLVEVYIDKTGRVAEAWVRKVYGIESFETASLVAVKQFRFKPVTENGEPQSFWVSFLISFKLN
ncbi:MAG: energy transducer TonB [Candidatus Krumholzibacteria bacterium]|nr:energy transducer TonB [Candidatus Krumholzibacteria bacterium]